MTNQCPLYTRCSISDQTTFNQHRELTKIAARMCLTGVAEFEDASISGAKGSDQRKGFDDLIEGAVRKDFDMILVWSVDRLGLSLQHLVPFLLGSGPKINITTTHTIIKYKWFPKPVQLGWV